MSKPVRVLVGWLHVYAGLFVGLESPGAGALFVAVGVAWWLNPR